MTGSITIGTIVEGHGDALAVPALIRRIAHEIFHVYDVKTPTPFRLRRGRMPMPEHLSKAARVVAARVDASGGVLVIADSDQDCAVELAAELSRAANPVPVRVAIAVTEFESWFLAAAPSLALHRAVRDDADYEGDPDSVENAKAKLQSLMVEKYRETLHQVAFAASLDMQQARRSRSFEHLVGQIGALVS